MLLETHRNAMTAVIIRRLGADFCLSRILWMLIILGCPSTGFEQGANADLSGQITDPGGAALPGAGLTIQNVGTGLKQAAISNDPGLYMISALSTGHYTLAVEKQGFQKSVQTGITLTVGQAATLNVPLRLGNVDESVTDCSAERGTIWPISFFRRMGAAFGRELRCVC